MSVIKKIIRINQQDYEYEILLFNTDGQFIFIDSNLLIQLVLTDNILNPFMKQQLSIKDDKDLIQKAKLSDFFDVKDSKNNNIFSFKGNGLDKVNIYFRPILQQDDSQLNNSVLDPFFIIEEEFVIVNIEDRLVSQTEKQKLLFLKSKDEFTLETNNSVFGTGKFKEQDKKQFSGKQIKECLLEALPNADIFPSWNSGGNRIFHCASKDESYLDTINEMLNKSISSNDDPLLLIKNRMKSYNLVSIKDMFNNQINQDGSGGAFFSDSYLLIESGNQGNILKPQGEQVIEKVNNTFTHYYNRIDNIEITPKDWNTAYSQLKSSCITAFDNTTSTFKIRHYPMNKTKDVFTDNYVSPFQKLYNAESNIEIPKAMKNGGMVDTELSVFGDDDTMQQFGLKKELSEMIFLNDIVRFRVPGLTHRKSGTFIEIKTENPLKNNEYNQRYVGVYLVLEVQHIFIGNIYETIISATKTYKSK